MKTSIQRMIQVFREAANGLQVDLGEEKLERLAIMVDKALNLQARNFHTPEHVFSFVNLPSPIQVLAALYHDIVYYQVDGGFSPEIARIVAPYISEQDDAVYIVENIPREDRLVWLTLEIFGFNVGQKLSPFQGLNEFLSALAMNKSMEGSVSEKDLLKMSVCIEATIPFRGKTSQGLTYGENMEARLVDINKRYQCGLALIDIEEAIRLAVVFSNRDVSDFSEKDVGRFLDGTWKLLPETNAALRHRGIYSIKEYRQALQKMEAFLIGLDPDTIFKTYKNTPHVNTYQQMVAMAYSNIQIAREYLGIKLLAVAFLEALADLTGGDAPLALFMGDIEKEGEEEKRLEDFLPQIDAYVNVDLSSALFRLLHAGRAGESNFDMRNSPLSLYLFKKLNTTQIKATLADAKEMFAGKMTAEKFLERADKEVTTAIACACSEMVSTRREKILAISR